MFSHHARFRFRSRLLVSLVLILAIGFGAVAQIRRRPQISSVYDPSPVAGTYFKRSFRFGGGVVPRGSAKFLSPTNTLISARQLELVILDKAKLANNRIDLDAIGLRWQGLVYKLAVPDDFIYPLMKFVQRGSYIVYTLPVAGFDPDYFKKNKLVEFRKVNLGGRSLMGYAAIEFKSRSQKAFLQGVDFAESKRITDAGTKARIIKDVTTRVGGSNRPIITGSTYVNADFHVTYRFYFTTRAGENVVDSGGLPLRYFWTVASDRTAVIKDVEVFTFPTEAKDPEFQDQAVRFFETAALLRQLNQDNRPAFNRFLKEVAAVTRK